jgi:tRNA1Val (adenine37-N6)-methyltransferase
MAKNYFQFKQFIVHQQAVPMKVCTDACLFGSWITAAFKGADVDTAKVLDIGTGTGLLSLMLAQELRGEIDTVEIDPVAAEAAIRNILLSPWKDRITIHQGDVLQFEPSTGYRLIVTNPPFYVNHLQASTVGKNLAKHENNLTLVQLFIYASSHLLPNGYFSLLLPVFRLEEALVLGNKLGLFIVRTALVQQTEQHTAFRVMLIFSTKQQQSISESITIRSGGHYTPRFVDLLRPFYLYL